VAIGTPCYGQPSDTCRRASSSDPPLSSLPLQLQGRANCLPTLNCSGASCVVCACGPVAFKLFNFPFLVLETAHIQNLTGLVENCTTAFSSLALSLAMSQLRRTSNIPKGSYASLTYIFTSIDDSQLRWCLGTMADRFAAASIGHISTSSRLRANC
jgi:hypothetical protein